jgi:hypothetical protein
MIVKVDRQMLAAQPGTTKRSKSSNAEPYLVGGNVILDFLTWAG